MKIKSTTAFRALAKGRSDRANERKKFMVKSTNKDGSVSRMAPSSLSWLLDAFETESEAEARRAHLEELNPGRSFVVVAL